MRQFFIVAALLSLLSVGALAASIDRTVFSSTDTGIAASALSGGVTSSALKVDRNTQSSLFVAVTAGTSASMTAQFQASHDNSTWFYVMVCEASTSGVSNCYKYTPTYDLALATSFVINLPTNYPFIKVTLNDAAAGSGTATATLVASGQ